MFDKWKWKETAHRLRTLCWLFPHFEKFLKMFGFFCQTRRFWFLWWCLVFFVKQEVFGVRNIWRENLWTKEKKFGRKNGSVGASGFVFIFFRIPWWNGREIASSQTRGNLVPGVLVPRFSSATSIFKNDESLNQNQLHIAEKKMMFSFSKTSTDKIRGINDEIVSECVQLFCNSMFEI